MNRSRVLVVAGLWLSLLSTAARCAAQDRPCGDDARKFCPDVTPGRGTIVRCLKPHLSELSEGCRKQIERLEERQKVMSDRQQRARLRRGGMHTPLAGTAVPAAATPQPTK